MLDNNHQKITNHAFAHLATLPLLSVDDTLKESIRHAVKSGKMVIIPQQELEIASYSGIGYVIYDPLLGSGAYLIDGGRQSSCNSSTAPQVNIIDPVVLLLAGPSFENYVKYLIKNPVLRKILLAMLMMSRVVAPMVTAVALAVALAVVTYMIMQALREAELERQVMGEVCQEEDDDGDDCKTKYPYHRLCDELLLEYDYMYGSEDEAVDYLNDYGKCPIRLNHKNTNPATAGPCSTHEFIVGTHSVYYCQGFFAASIGCCPCCIDNGEEPELDECCSILNSTID